MQGAVRFPEADARATEVESWWREFARLVAGISGIRGPGIALRFSVDTQHGAARLLSVHADAKDEAQLRRFLGRFALLEGVIEDSVELPVSRETFDAWFADFPGLRCRVALPPQGTGDDIWLSCQFRIAPHLGTLMEEAVAIGRDFSYQVNISPFEPETDLIRDVRKNAARLNHEPGVPPALAAYQDQLAEQFGNGRFLVEEYLGTSIDATADWLGDRLDQLFGETEFAPGLAAPEHDFETDGHPDAIGSALHRYIVFGPQHLALDELVSESATREVQEQLLSLRPPIIASSPPRDDGGDDPVSPDLPAPADAPTPYDGSESYVFVSYKHDDFEIINPVLSALGDTGVRYWYDRGIPGGSEWDEVLEDKIAECDILLAFVSAGAVKSKYCRREMKFADALDKPILAVKLEDAELAHGLQMLLLQYQMLDVKAADFDQALTSALESLKS